MDRLPEDVGLPAGRITTSKWKTLTLVVTVIVFASLTLAAVTVPWYGTEARRAVIGRAMFESLDFILPTHGGEPNLAKPPLYYWLEAGAMAVVGESRFASRLPNLALFGLLALLFAWAGRRFGRRDGAYALVGALFVLTHPLLGQFAATAELDGAFAVLICASLFTLCRAAQLGNEGLGWIASSGLLAGLAVLTKGPVCLLFLLPAFWPLRKQIGWAFGGAWLILAAIPFAVWLFALHDRGMLEWFFRRADQETIARFAFLDFGRIVKIPVDLGKFVLLLLPPLVLPFLGARGKKPIKAERQLVHRALLWAGVGGLLLFCFAPHRPSRYLLPAVAPLLFVLVHGSGPWLDPRARLGLPLDRPFDRVIDLEVAKVQFQRRLRWGICALLGVAAISLYAFVPWARIAPIALVFLAVAVAPWSFGPVVPLLGLGLAAQAIVTHDAGRRKSLGDRDRMVVVDHIASVTRTDSVTGWQHVPSELAWVLGERVIFDEFGRREVLTPWVVWEERFPTDKKPPVQVDEVLRLRLDRRDVVLGRVR